MNNKKESKIKKESEPKNELKPLDAITIKDIEDFLSKKYGPDSKNCKEFEFDLDEKTYLDNFDDFNLD